MVTVVNERKSFTVLSTGVSGVIRRQGLDNNDRVDRSIQTRYATHQVCAYVEVVVMGTVVNDWKSFTVLGATDEIGRKVLRKQ